MPAFMFEKIVPPARRGATALVERKPRGVIVRIMDRFVGMRIKRRLKAEKNVIAGREEK